MTKKECDGVNKLLEAIYNDKEKMEDLIALLETTLLNVITAVEKERKLSGKGKQLPVIKEAYSVLKSLK